MNVRIYEYVVAFWIEFQEGVGVNSQGAAIPKLPISFSTVCYLTTYYGRYRRVLLQKDIQTKNAYKDFNYAPISESTLLTAATKVL